MIKTFDPSRSSTGALHICAESKQHIDPYIKWLEERRLPLLRAAGVWWTLYHQALVPASPKPQPVDLRSSEARELLHESGALFLRYFSQTYMNPTEFWYTACDRYEPHLSRKLKGEIRRAYKNCRVARTDPLWLAANAYGCYRAAFARYQGQQPLSEKDFQNNLRQDVGGPFDFWAVFAGDVLAGYSKCISVSDHANMTVFRLDPDYLRYYPAYALLDTMLTFYVREHGITVSNGFRSVTHDTQMQKFVLKFGFRNIYCDLKLVYAPAVRVAVNLLYAAKIIIPHIPDLPGISQLKGLLRQEEIRRSFKSASFSCLMQ